MFPKQSLIPRLVSLSMVLIITSCDSGSNDAATTTASIGEVSCATGQGLYQVGDTVTITCDVPAGLTGTLSIRNLSLDSPPVFNESLKSGGNSFIWQVGESADDAAHGILATATNGAGTTSTRTFFRVANENALSTFQMGADSHDGQAIILLRGGLSAEYAVAKAAASLSSGIAHSWMPSAPGSGPEPVLATPNFLASSLLEVVDFYDETLGVDTPFDTAIISTGFPAIPYIARSIGAPVLPIHFLVSVDTVAEIETILDSAETDGISAYSTLGHDTSLPLAVAWVKLLDLPEVYADFLKRHGVEHVVMMGSTGTTGGETKARMVINGDTTQYRPKSIYILYPGTSPDDEATLSAEITDLSETQLAAFEHISDWESGVISNQLNNFSRSIESQSEAKSLFVTAQDLIHLYDLATYSSLALMQKDLMNGGKSTPVGLVLNPYLMGYPTYEHWNGYVPYVYWQGNPPNLIAERSLAIFQAGLDRYFPGMSAKDLTVWMNSTRNFGGFFAPAIRDALSGQGVTQFKENDYELDENWDPADGYESTSEQVVLAVVEARRGGGFDEWEASVDTMSVDELLDVARSIEGIDIVDQRAD